MTAHPLALLALVAAALAATPGARSMRLHSDAFAPGAEIPRTHTCDGKGLAPPLAWSDLPAGTRTLALVVDDPDAPRGTWVHWVVYNLPPAPPALPEGGALPPGARQGKNDWGKTGYGGPCPPSGRHRYSHRLYALDTELPDLASPDKARLEAAMKGHVLGQAELVGTYARAGKGSGR
jgi:Raf kinase inhibitor-like YbhB/YbcL family protein